MPMLWGIPHIGEAESAKVEHDDAIDVAHYGSTEPGNIT